MGRLPHLRPLKIVVASTTNPRSKKGNRITAVRWAELLRQLGHDAQVVPEYEGGDADLLVALHAARGHASMLRFRAEHPGRPVILALTGTDLYGDIRTDPRAKQSLELADRLVVLQPLALSELPKRLHRKVRVIHQSALAPPPRDVEPTAADAFEVAVLGHLRPVKDPFRAAHAARLLPEASRIRIVHMGALLTAGGAEAVADEEERNPRYRYLGELDRQRALRVLGRCRLLVLTSISEGGANVVAEAIACGVPVISTRIPGSVGLLGEDYPGYFPVQDTRALATLLWRAESEPGFLALLADRCAKLEPLVRPSHERATWDALVRELVPAAQNDDGALQG